MDNFAISVDKSAKPVDNFLGLKKLSTGKPTYPHFIHRVIHKQNSWKILIKKDKKSYPQKIPPNNNNLYI
ncbi:MAG: hypothetical protein R3F37_18225 [Candidatus Competibacteraceae bacterium]